jgi:hypothetical protein
MKRGKIRLLLYSLAAHAATGKEGFVFFLINFQFIKKKKQTSPFS